MTNKTIFFWLVVVAIVAIGAYFFPQSVIKKQVAGSTVGVTNSTAKIAQIVANGTGTYKSTANNYLWTALYNSDDNDRVISSIDAYYEGLTTISTSTAALRIYIATSTTGTTIGSNTNYVLVTNVATSTPILWVASTSPGIMGISSSNDFSRVWKAGTYLTVVSNGTTSANVILKVNYVAE